MSSSRDHVSFTGVPTCLRDFDRIAYVIGAARRPNPPPIYMVWILTFPGQPGNLRRRSRAGVCICVGAHTSQLSAFTRAVQFIGSMGACARNGA